ncbi:uncharacterized protein LOC112554765 [Pomacea canaliculata]|uniref:uncharacterized protein LOC112554765 n=1 Tax=Pomacea canaliculata TaxID=400727 RepID=UPI000D73C597|nr:uncharacterized protein LOC112554765 [Pomacea canaliculata]XP_025078555.1 uncharacterized protein LOC112554765 [Pomacea canaliculata]
MSSAMSEIFREMEVWGLLLLLFVASSSVAEYQCWICDSGQSIDPSKPLAFVDEYVQKHVITVSQTGNLSCCSGYRTDTKTSWYKFNPDNKTWLIIHADGTAPPRITGKICDGGQTLRFDAVDIIADRGTYSCNASNSRRNISRTFNVIVSSCEKVFKPKIIRQPEPVIQVKIGSSFQQSCEGNFGCRGAVSANSQVWWSYEETDGQIHKLLNGTVDRYSVEEVISEDESMMSAIIKIENVTKGDTTRIFFCTLTKNNDSTGFKISLMIQDSPTVIEKYETLIAGLCTVTGIFAISVIVCYRFCRHYLIYKWKIITRSLPQRGDKEFDVMVVDPSEETEISSRIREELRRRNYSVYQVHPSERGIIQIDDVHKCSTAIFVLETEAEESDFLVRYFAVCREERIKPIFILTGEFTDLQQVFGKDYRTVYEQFPQLYKVLHWPGHHSKFCYVKNFWAAILSELPPSMVNSKTSGASDHSIQHLLALGNDNDL